MSKKTVFENAVKNIDDVYVKEAMSGRKTITRKRIFIGAVAAVLAITALIMTGAAATNAYIQNAELIRPEQEAKKTGKYIPLMGTYMSHKSEIVIDMETGEPIFTSRAKDGEEFAGDVCLDLFEKYDATYIDCTDEYIAFIAEYIYEEDEEGTKNYNYKESGTKLYVYDIKTKELTQAYVIGGENVWCLKCIGNHVLFGVGDMRYLYKYNVETKRVMLVFDKRKNPEIEFCCVDEKTGEFVYRLSQYYAYWFGPEDTYYITNKGKFDWSKKLLTPDWKSYALTMTGSGYFEKYDADSPAVFDYHTGKITELQADFRGHYIVKHDDDYCFTTLKDYLYYTEASFDKKAVEPIKQQIYVISEDGSGEIYEITSDFYVSVAGKYKDCVLLYPQYYRDGDVLKFAPENGYGRVWLNLKTGDMIAYKSTQDGMIPERQKIVIEKKTLSKDAKELPADDPAV